MVSFCLSSISKSALTLSGVLHHMSTLNQSWRSEKAILWVPSLSHRAASGAGSETNSTWSMNLRSRIRKNRGKLVLPHQHRDEWAADTTLAQSTHPVALTLPDPSSKPQMTLFNSCIKSKVCMWHSRLLAILIYFLPCLLLHSWLQFIFLVSPFSFDFWFPVSHPTYWYSLYDWVSSSHATPQQASEVRAIVFICRWGHWNAKRIRNLPELGFSSGVLDPEPF